MEHGDERPPSRDRTLAEALHYPGADDVEFDPPRADGGLTGHDSDRQRLLDLAAKRLGTSTTITDKEVGPFAAELEARLPSAQKPIGGWYPADVLRVLSKG